jgi:hypothetical protein
VAKKKKPSQLQHLLLLQHLRLLLLMQLLQPLQPLLLLAPLLPLQPLLQHQPASNYLLKTKKPLQSGFFYVPVPAYLISCSSNKVSKRYPAGVFSGLPASS